MNTDASGGSFLSRAPRSPALFSFFLVVVIAVAAARLWFIGEAMPSSDEAYIWNGARDLQLCYRDFPALVPALVRAGTAVFGNTSFGIRVPFVLLFAAVALHAFAWARREAGPRAGLVAGLLALGAFPVAAMGAVYAATDSALAVSWYFATFFLWRAATAGRAADWLLTGIALLAGCLSKYLMLFWVGGAFAYLILDRRRRHWLARPQPYLVLAIGAMSAIPFFLWNAQHDWSGLLFQVSERHDVKPTLKHIAGMLGGQIALATPILFAALVLAIRRALRVRRDDPRRDLLDALVVFSLATLVFLLPIGIFVRVSPLWPAVGYLPAAIILGLWAAEPAARRRIGWISAAMVLNATLVLGFHAFVFRPQALFDFVGSRLEAIRPTKFSAQHIRAFYGWKELAAQVDTLIAAEPDLFVLTPKSAFASYLSFYTAAQIDTFLYREVLADGTVLGEKAVNCLNQTLWQDTSTLASRPGLFITHQPDSATTLRVAGLFRTWTLVEELPIVVRGAELRRFHIFRGEAFAGWPVPAPR